MKKGTHIYAITYMRFPGIRLLKKTERKFLKENKKGKKRMTVIVGLFYFLEAPTKKTDFQ